MSNPELLGRIAALEAQLVELQVEVTKLRKPKMWSMRTTGRCPGCGGGTLLHFRRIQEIGHGKSYEMTLQKDFSTWWGLQSTGGALEAYACRTCNLVEWHARSLADVQPDGEEVVAINTPNEPDNPTGPYR